MTGKSRKDDRYGAGEHDQRTQYSTFHLVPNSFFFFLFRMWLRGFVILQARGRVSEMMLTLLEANGGNRVTEMAESGSDAHALDASRGGILTTEEVKAMDRTLCKGASLHGDHHADRIGNSGVSRGAGRLPLTASWALHASVHHQRFASPSHHPPRPQLWLLRRAVHSFCHEDTSRIPPPLSPRNLPIFHQVYYSGTPSVGLAVYSRLSFALFYLLCASCPSLRVSLAASSTWTVEIACEMLA